ncbi:hypothetical protein QOT17_017463 [Balamuthia mandrillaris]
MWRHGGVMARGVHRRPFPLPASLHFPVSSLPFPPVRHFYPSLLSPAEGKVEDKRRNPEEQHRPSSSSSSRRRSRVAGRTESKEASRRREERHAGQEQLQTLTQGGGRGGGGDRLEAGAVKRVLEEMEREGERAGEKVLLALLERCKQERNLKASQRVHAHLLHLSSDQGVFSRLAASLISAYGACGRLDLAREVFHHHHHHHHKQQQQEQQQQQQERGKREKGGAAMWNAMMQACTQCGDGQEALQLFQEMEEAGVPADPFTFSIVLKACGMMKDVETGKRVHRELLRCGSLSLFEANALITMYGKCGKMEEARAVFQGMKERDVVTWNTMIAAATQSGHGQEALQLFQEMRQAGVAADAFTFPSVLKACGMVEDLEMGKRVHAEVLRRGLQGNIVLCNALISMYSTCRRMEEARAVFQGMKKRDVVTWNTMIAAATQSGHGQEALQLFQEMRQAGVAADAFTFPSVLKACGMVEDLEMGKRVHAEVLRRGLQGNIVLCNALISMYSTCRSMEEARAVFQGMKKRDVMTWNTMIAAATQSGHGQEALQLFQEMQQAGVATDAITFAAVLKACGMMEDVEMGKRVHAEMLRRGSLSTPEANALITMYGTCGRMEEAHAVFQGMKERDVVTWTTMIAAATQSGRGQEALQLFQEMQQAGVVANAFTFSSVLKACWMRKDMEMGKRVHAEVLRRGLHADPILSTALINFYDTCGRMEEVRAVFQGMKDRDEMTWTTMIAGETQSGHGEEALQLFQEMQQAGVAANAITFAAVLKACGMMEDVEMGKRVHAEMLRRGSLSIPESNALITMYGKCGKIEEARAVFQGMKERDVVTWSAMIAAATQSGHGQEALQLFQEMQQAGVATDAFTFPSVLKACGMVEDLEMGKRVHAEVLRRGLQGNIVLCNALISMYSTCRSMEEARAVFQGMKKRDVMTWNTMIAAATQSGHGEEALQLFQEMEEAGVPADPFTFSIVLKACGMMKDVETGKRVHRELLRCGSLSLFEANALITMYGKCGKMEEARAVFQGMKERDVVTWNTMIAAATQSGHGQEALQLFQEMQQAGMEPRMWSKGKEQQSEPLY